MIKIGDCLEQLRTLPDESVNCCVTSPPYFGLRDYGTAQWEGGDSECDHKGAAKASDKCGLKNDGRPNPGRKEYELSATVPFRDVCGKCGAVRIDNQIGLEKTPQEFIAKLVAVFAEVKRVLTKDGTLWVNMGDSYNANYRGGGVDNASYKQGSNRGTVDFMATDALKIDGLKPKNLLGMPWRLAFALQDDGWYLRSDIIWAKPNPMPESVRDRPTKAHEYIFLLTRSERYWYDADAIRYEPKWQGPTATEGAYHDHDADLQQGQRIAVKANNPKGCNARTVWTIATQPYKEAHFATYPEELPKRCILAGCPEGGTVLDPFLGSGTTVAVAISLGRKGIGIELNPEYAELARKRISGVTPGMFTGDAA